jgi:hypothetical protein
VDLRVVEGRGEQLIEDSREDPVPVGSDLGRRDPGPIDGALEQAAGCLGVTAR